LKMFDAMILKREIGKECKLDVQILETSNDGLVLRLMENIVNRNSLDFITDFVNKHDLNIILDNGVYFISEQILTPYEPIYLSE